MRPTASVKLVFVDLVRAIAQQDDPTSRVMTVNLERVEQELGGVADVALVHPRTMRYVIKAHRAVPGVGLVPHTRCYAITRDEFHRVAGRAAYASLRRSGHHQLLLVCEPTANEVKRLSRAELFERVLQAAFHAHVHSVLERRISEGLLSESLLNRRIEQLGRAEFQEIRAIVTHDEVLMPPGTDLDVYVEFAATYLELRRFAPELVAATFPGLGDPEDMDEILSADLEVARLLAGDGGEVAIPLTVRRSPARTQSVRPPPVSARRHLRLMRASARASERRQHAKSALLAARGVAAPNPELSRSAEEALGGACRKLAFRLDEALGGPPVDEAGTELSWVDRIGDLALAAANRRGFRSAPEAAVLLDLERAVVAYEQPGVIVDVGSFVLSLGRRKVVRPRTATRELQFARIIDAAAQRLPDVRLSPAAQADLTRLIKAAAQRAEDRVRAALRHRIVRTFERVRLVARSEAERLSRDKLIEDLLDGILARGFLSLPQLRDALSENQLKLPDLAGPRELREGDPLLKADAELDVELDGLYRRGDVYLRWLQKFSSLPFGTRVGRAVTLFALLPALGAFTVIEGTRQVLNPLLGLFDVAPLPQPGWIALTVTALIILALLHSELARVLARALLDGVGVVLAWLLFRIPRAIITTPFVVRLLERPAARWFIRRILLPAFVAGIAFLVAPLYDERPIFRGMITAGAFTVMSLVMGSRVGWWLEGVFLEQIAPTWHVLSRQWLPGLLRLIGRAFAGMMDKIDRGIRRVENALRFRRTDETSWLVLAGLAGAVWGVVAYVIRLYMTLLVEPEINPLKHFPVVTVAHKLLLPFIPQLLEAIEPPFMIFGSVIGGAGAAITVFLVPSVFGFLAWELKENYRIYRATRAPRIEAARFGPDGETMRGLLVVGIHSGTVPKLHERLRHAARRKHQEKSVRTGDSGKAASGVDAAFGRFREGMRVLARSLTRFVERELVMRFATSPRWKQGPVTVERVDFSSNRIRVRLRCAASPDLACELTFEQLGELIVASLPQPGFVAELDPEQALLFENALAVFYHRAEVGLVREQLEVELGDVAHYGIVGDRLLAWPDDDYEVELSYPLGVYRQKTLTPKLSGRQPEQRPLEIDSCRILYRQQVIDWSAWERACQSAVDSEAMLPRLVKSASLLPTGVLRSRHEAD